MVNTLRERVNAARAAGLAPTARTAGQAVTGQLRRLSPALVAGVLGSLAAIVVMGALRLIWGTPTPPELIGERILPLLPANQFVAFLIRFQPNPKTSPLGLAVLGQFVVGILLGPLFHLIAEAPGGRGALRGRWPSRRAWATAAAFLVVMEVVAVALFWPVLPGGLVGDPVGRARALTAFAMLLTFLAAVVVLALADQWLYRVFGAWAEPTATQRGEATMTTSGAGVSRRAALQTAGAVVVAVAVGAEVVHQMIEAYLARTATYDGMTPNFTLTPAITPTRDFYIVTKNAIDPSVSLDRWQLQVTGLVHQERSWSYEQTRQLPSETRAVTQECIANQVGAQLMSTALFTGTTLETLLHAAGGVKDTASWVVFHSVDDYVTSLPLADLLKARTLLAWQMNGEDLPDRHGYPLRAVVPGRFGEQSPKWLTQVEVTDHEVKGLYASQGWNIGQVPTTSRIDRPSQKATLGEVPVSGIAFGGIRGIQRVEVSADNGQTWQNATLTPPLSDQSWVLWRWTWLPSAPGDYTLVVRATDGTGAVQTQTQRNTVPDGATGWYHVTVHVS